MGKIDLHIHTVKSPCGLHTLLEILGLAAERIDGIRKLLGVPDRPLLHSMIKPSIGLTPEQGGKPKPRGVELLLKHASPSGKENICFFLYSKGFFFVRKGSAKVSDRS